MDSRIYDAIELLDRGAFSEAVPLVKHLAGKLPKYWYLLVMLAECYEMQGMLPEAYECYSKVIKRDVDKHPEWWLARARIAIGLRQFDKAMQDARVVGMRLPNFFHRPLLQAKIYEEQGDLALAGKNYRQALRFVNGSADFEVIESAAHFLNTQKLWPILTMLSLPLGTFSHRFEIRV